MITLLLSRWCTLWRLFCLVCTVHRSSVIGNFVVNYVKYTKKFVWIERQNVGQYFFLYDKKIGYFEQLPVEGIFFRRPIIVSRYFTRFSYPFSYRLLHFRKSILQREHQQWSCNYVLCWINNWLWLWLQTATSKSTTSWLLNYWFRL